MAIDFSRLTTRWAIVRHVSNILSLAILIMLTALLSIVNMDSTWFYADGMGVVNVLVPLGAVNLPLLLNTRNRTPPNLSKQNCWSILWNTISLCLTLFLGWYHPGADIAMDFVTMGMNFGMGGMLIAWVAPLPSNYYSTADALCEKDNYYDTYDAQACSDSKTVDGVEWTAGVLLLIVGYVLPSAFHMLLWGEARC